MNSHPHPCRAFRFLASTVCLVVASACATAPRSIAPAHPFNLELQAGKTAEECFALTAAERIEYRFEATTAVDFNLHTHRGGETITPVDVKRTRAQAGTYAAPRAEEYCLMWTNAGATPAFVRGEWRQLRQ
jgi:hypothetical protein